MCLCNGTACADDATCLGSQTCACNTRYEGNGTECLPVYDEFDDDDTSAAYSNTHGHARTPIALLLCACVAVYSLFRQRGW
eukprot:2365096-Rhodomonas_salina.1